MKQCRNNLIFTNTQCKTYDVNIFTNDLIKLKGLNLHFLNTIKHLKKDVSPLQ